MERHRIGIVIPALNESGTIAAVVENASRYGVPIVVDDGSQDRTSELATAAGACVVRHSVKRGYDQALNSGFARAAELGCQYAVTVDADGQHDLSILDAFIRGLDDGADVVAGVRDRHQRFAESLFAWVASRKWRLRDPLCGMKAYRMPIYKELGHFDSYDSIGTELVIYAAESGKRVSQLAVKTYRRIDAPRFGGRVSANLRLLRALWLGLWLVKRPRLRQA